MSCAECMRQVEDDPRGGVPCDGCMYTPPVDTSLLALAVVDAVRLQLDEHGIACINAPLPNWDPYVNFHVRTLIDGTLQTRPKGELEQLTRVFVRDTIRQIWRVGSEAVLFPAMMAVRYDADTGYWEYKVTWPCLQPPTPAWRAAWNAEWTRLVDAGIREPHETHLLDMWTTCRQMLCEKTLVTKSVL
jgi:hypothetical protein